MMLELDPDAVWSPDEEGTALLYSDSCKSEEGPTLSQDIWNKFDLLPTPPRTPSRDTTDLDLGPLPEDLDLAGTLGFDKNFGPNFGPIDFPLMEGDELNLNFDMDTSLPSELAGVMPIDFTSMGSGIACSHGQVHDTCTSCKKLALAGSELRHDCMWIGTCTAEAHAHQKSRIHHDSTCSHINDLMESHGSLETVARFTQLEDDFRDDDDDVEEDDDEAMAYSHMSRPDTPSESSETDSDEEVDKTKYAYGEVHHEEEVFTSGSPASTGLAHSDHTYYCLPPPSPSAKSVQQPQMEPVSSDTEDEIDVVSVGSSVDSGYTSGRHKKRSLSSCNGNSPGKKSKTNGGSIVLSNNTDGSKKVLRIHTSTTSSSHSASSSGKIKMLHHETPAEGVKLKSRRNASQNGRMIQKSPKRLQQAAQQQGRGGNRKKSSPRSDVDDPDKREIHNSMERLRRVDLKNAFEELRVLIPDLIEKEKAPKVEILKKSAQYCIALCEEERRLLAQIEREKKYHQSLLKKLYALDRR